MSEPQELTVLIEADEAGYLTAEVPALRGCYTQARGLDELMLRIREVIALCLAEQEADLVPLRFVGVQRVTICVAGARCAARNLGKHFGGLASSPSGSARST